MNEPSELEALVYALGIRPIRVSDLSTVLFLRRHGIILLPADLSPQDAAAATDRVLQHVTETAATAGQ